jgi:hypothetical protein
LPGWDVCLARAYLRASGDNGALTHPLLQMWYDVALYIVGALIGIIEASINHPWKPFEDHMAFGLVISLVSLLSSSLGGVASAFKVNNELGERFIWIPIATAAIFSLANGLILLNKITTGWCTLRAKKTMGLSSATSIEDCLRFLNIKKLKKALKKKFPGIKLTKSLLRSVVELRFATPGEIEAHLRRLRAKSHFKRFATYKYMKKELQTIFLITLCLDSLKDTRPSVIKHMRTLTIALARSDKARDFKFKNMLEGWELPSEINAEEIGFESFDYGGMKRVEFPLEKRMHQCDLCKSFWKDNWKEAIFKKTTCRCCELFETLRKQKPLDIESGIPRPYETEEDPAASSAGTNVAETPAIAVPDTSPGPSISSTTTQSGQDPLQIIG